MPDPTGGAKRRVAIYARMSTDLQSAQSPADQIAHCRRFAESRGWEVVPELIAQDAGISGASRHNRPALTGLIDRIDEWDVLLAYDWSRITRNGEDFHWLRNTLTLHDRTAFEASTGLDIENIGSQVLAVMNEQYLAKLAADTHRGLRGKAERGLSAGGRPYGYKTIEVEGGKQLVIENDHAAVVRRIFDLYEAGNGLHVVVQQLNEDGVPSPRGKAWAFTAVREMIRNPVYRGEVIWNKSRWVKNHATGKRKRIERPESEWFRRQDETLRIIDEAQWNRVHREIGARSILPRVRGGDTRVGAAVKRARTKRTLAGFVACGECGGSFYAASRTRWTCGQRRDRGSIHCGNTAQPLETELEERLFSAIEDRVLVPDAIAYVAEQTIAKIREGMERPGKSPEQRAQEIGQQIEKLVKLAARAGDVEEIGAQIEAPVAERRALLEATPAVVPAYDPDVFRPAILRMVGNLGESLRGTPEMTRETLRALFGDERIRVFPSDDAGFALKATARLALFPSCTDVLVAGARFNGSEHLSKLRVSVVIERSVSAPLERIRPERCYRPCLIR